MLNVEIKSFGYTDKEILKSLSFSVKQGEHLVVLGESGGGKSTLLHLIYGLLPLEHGAVSWFNKPLLGPAHSLIPGEKFIKLVAQDFNVMPFTTVSENIATHLSKLDEKEDEARISELLQVVELTDFRNTLVKNLSGGQKQRVAIATALANAPELLLLDEPFSNIDTFRKNKLRRQLFSFLKQNNISCITATHDAEEALSFSDKILILNNGTLDTIGTPEAVFHGISTPFQAGFFSEYSVLPTYVLTNTGAPDPMIVLPHELKVTLRETKLEIKVIKSYFKGVHYLICGTWDGQTVYFNHPNALKTNKTVYLKYYENT
jgi:iron(III) transport system ATP-binding protein